MIALAEIVDKTRQGGLVMRGALRLAADERIKLRAGAARTLALIGFVGAAGWRVFERSMEAADGGADSLDRWSRRIIDGLARDCGADALYPFDGPPYWPFQRWAMRAEPVHPTPLGLLIHPDFGLWHSYRGALAFADELAIPALEKRPSPCESCADRPCLNACPVGAFAQGSYDSARCGGHLRGPSGHECLNGGCLARRACPVGADREYGPSQARFHMRAFVAGMGAPDS